MRRLPLGTVLVGDAAEQLRRLPPAAVDTVVTSPPYFALRRYGVPEQLGLEDHVEQWVSQLLAVTDELARVLKPSGSLWLNLGDSYSRGRHYGAPAKSLLLAPERLLLKLSDQGWLVRNKVVWAKANPMPASVADRLTCAWEPLYLLTRSPAYFFDLDAIRQPQASSNTASRRRVPGPKPPPAWAGPLAGNQSGLDGLKAAGRSGHPLGKNPGDVWTLSTSNDRSGHHASFPAALIERPLLATCPERTCISCGQPWHRQRLAPGCACGASWQPGVVLDPFMGSGTTAVVAEQLGRAWLGIELNPVFVALTQERLARARGGRRAAA